MKHSSTGLSASFAQAEINLIDSEVYQYAIAELTALTGEAIETAHNLLTLVGREAMRLAAQQITQPPQAAVANGGEQEVVATQTDTQSETRQHSSFALPKLATKQPEVPTTQPDRAEQCRRIGKTLREARQAKGMSQQQLYARTHVPLYQIQALEKGQLEKLPEDVYLRGFIRQLANALNLNGVALAASLSESTTAVVPSWYRDRGAGGQLLPIHLYLGYTAVVAGAIGGISWMSHHNAMTATIDEIDTGSDRQTTLSPKHSSQSRATQAAAQAATSIAPPETMSN